jgi:uncharacterized protein YjeT (DUF2065 family)
MKEILLKENYLLYILMFIISFCLVADASLLIFDPALYRKSLNYVNETLGPVWGVLYGLLFTFCAVFVFISVIFSRVSFLYIFTALVMAGTGLFFLLSETQKFEHLSHIWVSLSDKQYRLAGIMFVILAAVVCYVTVMVR